MSTDESINDPIGKALARAQEGAQGANPEGQQGSSVRNWVKPERTDRVGGRTNEPRAAAAGELADFAIPAELDPGELLQRNVLTGQGGEDLLAADRYRLLRTRIRQRMQPRGWNKLGITSPGSKEGKSLTAINLSIATARDTQGSVVLVDADLRRPAIGKYLGLYPKAGLSEYLSGEAELTDIVYRLNVANNLYVVPTQLMDRPLAPSHSPGSSARMQALLDVVATPNTTLIMDLPPIMVADDVLSLAPLLDALMIIIRDGRTNIDDLREGAQLLSGFNLLGTVLNAAEEDSKRLYGYYYGTGDRKR
ncbi:MAG: CpsD/CapB family tyrosine-protein kinase [Pseudomonadota bacterium]